MKFTVAGLCALSVTLCACASITEGTSQDISVNTTPAGATCIFERQGMNIGMIQSTPATLNIPKRKYDVLIRCNKAGYQEATYLNHSGVTAVIAANVATDILLTAGLSSIIDSSTGADNKYDSAVNLTLIPLAGAPTASAPAAQPIPVSTNTPATGQRACTEQERTQKRIAIMNNYSTIPNCQ